MKHKSWIIVANSQQARILKVESVGVLKKLSELKNAHEHEMVGQDAASRANHPSPVGHHHAKEPRTTAHQKDAVDFAKEVVAFLEKAFSKGDYEYIYLVAEPRFLGNLRHNFSAHLTQRIAGEVPKDLVSEDLQRVWGHLPFAV